MIAERNCARCRSPFTSKSNRAKYCTSNCAMSALRQQRQDCKITYRNGKRAVVARTADCAQCRKPFSTCRSDKRFCTTACKLTAKRLSNVKVHHCCKCGMRLSGHKTRYCSSECHASVRITAPVKACVQCGNSFKPTGGGALFCGAPCKSKRNRKAHAAAKVLAVRTIHCEACATPIETADTRKRFCDKRCANKIQHAKAPTRRAAAKLNPSPPKPARVPGRDPFLATAVYMKPVGFTEARPRVSTSAPLVSCESCRGYGGSHSSWCREPVSA
jgi:hypothetical protein